MEAIEKAFGADVDYGQIIKTYGNEESSDNRRYSHRSSYRAEKKIVSGQPRLDLISTSYVERLNATTRLHMRRLTRLTLAFARSARTSRRRSGCTSPITTSSSVTTPCAAPQRWPLAYSLHSGALGICWRRRRERTSRS